MILGSIILALFDTKISSPEQMEKILGVKTLGIIPVINGNTRRT